MIVVVKPYAPYSWNNGYTVMSPVSTAYNTLTADEFLKEADKAIKLKTMVNIFNTNDLNLADEVTISVYSDAIGNMFKCGEYQFRSGDIVDFEDLEIPCNELVTMTITENDPVQNDGHTILIPCKPYADMTFDLKVPKGTVQENLDVFQNVNRTVKYLNNWNPFPQVSVAVNAATKITDYAVPVLKASGTDESEALYNIRIEGVQRAEGANAFKPDSRIGQAQCGASTHAFSQSNSASFTNDGNAPFRVDFAYLINQYGTNDKDGKDELEMNVYSDYLRQALKFPKFEGRNNQGMIYEDITIPCREEIIVSLADTEFFKTLEVHNTLRIPCNSASTGKVVRQFRLYAVAFF